MSPQTARRGSDTAIAALRHDWLLLPVAAGAAVMYGALVAQAPMLAIALIAGAALVVLTFAFPVAHFTLLLAATAILPYTVQNSFGFGGGAGAPGLVVSDVLLLSGIARGVYALLASPRLSAGELTAIGLLLAYLALATAQFLRGVFIYGAGVSQAGDELRSLTGLAAMLIALPLLRDPASRRRLLNGMLVIGLALGAWGIAQWALKLGFSGGFGLRQGGGAAAGPGQLQGGLYGFPVAVALSVAALLSGDLRSTTARWLVIATLVLNGICVVLTYERTFILITVLACALIVLRAGRGQRARALLLVPVAVALICVPLAAFSPATLTTARERLLSLGQYGQDQSVRDRVVESQHIIEQIRLRPLQGSGLGAAIWWGRPENGVPPAIDYFGHNGYLWISWKLGIVTAVLLFGSIVLAGLRPGRARGTPLFAMVAVGAQAALLGLLVACVTFPSVTARPITVTMGLLLAMCAVPRQDLANRAGRGVRSSP
jgi:O-antigen ligase